jgi:hypothetical protein
MNENNGCQFKCTVIAKKVHFFKVWQGVKGIDSFDFHNMQYIDTSNHRKN